MLGECVDCVCTCACACVRVFVHACMYSTYTCICTQNVEVYFPSQVKQRPVKLRPNTPGSAILSKDPQCVVFLFYYLQ